MIKVKIKGKDGVYILVGTGYGMFKSQGQGGWGSLPSTTKGDSRIVAVCDKEGNIIWVKSEMVTIISIDDKPLKDIL